jgi:hypothetical protein
MTRTQLGRLRIERLGEYDGAAQSMSISLPVRKWTTGLRVNESLRSDRDRALRFWLYAY